MLVGISPYTIRLAAFGRKATARRASRVAAAATTAPSSRTAAGYQGRIRPRRVSDLSGVLSTRAPKGASASSTAAARAADAGKAPLSPTPLTPRGLSVLGVVRWTIRMEGTCRAVGITYSNSDCAPG